VALGDRLEFDGCDRLAGGRWWCSSIRWERLLPLGLAPRRLRILLGDVMEMRQAWPAATAAGRCPGNGRAFSRPWWRQDGGRSSCRGPRRGRAVVCAGPADVVRGRRVTRRSRVRAVDDLIDLANAGHTTAAVEGLVKAKTRCFEADRVLECLLAILRRAGAVSGARDRRELSDPALKRKRGEPCRSGRGWTTRREPMSDGAGKGNRRARDLPQGMRKRTPRGIRAAQEGTRRNQAPMAAKAANSESRAFGPERVATCALCPIARARSATWFATRKPSRRATARIGGCFDREATASAGMNAGRFQGWGRMVQFVAEGGTRQDRMEQAGD